MHLTILALRKSLHFICKLGNWKLSKKCVSTAIKMWGWMRSPAETQFSYWPRSICWDWTVKITYIPSELAANCSASVQGCTLMINFSHFVFMCVLNYIQTNYNVELISADYSINPYEKEIQCFNLVRMEGWKKLAAYTEKEGHKNSKHTKRRLERYKRKWHIFNVSLIAPYKLDIKDENVSHFTSEHCRNVKYPMTKNFLPTENVKKKKKYSHTLLKQNWIKKKIWWRVTESWIIWQWLSNLIHWEWQTRYLALSLVHNRSQRGSCQVAEGDIHCIVTNKQPYSIPREETARWRTPLCLISPHYAFQWPFFCPEPQTLNHTGLRMS